MEKTSNMKSKILKKRREG